MSYYIIEERQEMLDKIVCIKNYLYQLGFIEQNGNNSGNYNAINMEVSLDNCSSAKEAVDYVYNMVVEKLLTAIEQKQTEISNADGDERDEYDADFAANIVDWDTDYEEWNTYAPYRHFPNEVKCPPVCKNLLDLVISEFHENCEGGEYEVEYYDFRDYSVTFETLDEAEGFILNYVSTGSLFVYKGNERCELYSF